MATLTVIERFNEKHEPVTESGCWLWTGRVSESGYGKFSVGPSERRAHRTSWELFIGPIPNGMYICHKCDTRCCVNPEHLFLGTAKDNADDRETKGRGAINRGGGGWNRGIPHEVSHPNGALGKRARCGAVK